MKLENGGGARQHTSTSTAGYANVPCWLRCVPLLPNVPRASTPTFRRYRSSYSSEGIPPLHYTSRLDRRLSIKLQQICFDKLHKKQRKKKIINSKVNII